MIKWPLRTGLWCLSRLGRMNWSSNERGNWEMDKRGRGEEFGADYYWCRDVQTVGQMGGEVWERWVCPFVGRIGIIVVILDNCDVHLNCPPLWPRNYPQSSLFLIRYFRLLLTPSLFTTVIQINVHVVFTVSLWGVKAKEEFRRWVGVGVIWSESRLCICWIIILFSYCHCQEEISSDRDQLPQPIIKLS